MSSSPVSSPAAPAGGCRVAAAMPVISHRASARRPQQLQPALGAALGRRGRVDAGQAGQGGDVVAELRVVLHGARPERVGAEVDRVLPVGQPGEVGDQVALGDLGAAAPGSSRQPSGRDQLRRAGHSGTPVVRNDQACRPGLGQLEDGRLGVPARRAGRWWPGRRRPAPEQAPSSPHRLLQGRRRRRRSRPGSGVRSPRPAGRRSPVAVELAVEPTGTPARNPSSAMRSTTVGGGTGSRRANSRSTGAAATSGTTRSTASSASRA